LQQPQQQQPQHVLMINTHTQPRNIHTHTIIPTQANTSSDSAPQANTLATTSERCAVSEAETECECVSECVSVSVKE